MSAAMSISIIRDLVDVAINDTRAQMREEVKARAHKAAEDRVVEALAGKDAREQTRDLFRGKLKRGELDDTMIEIDVADAAPPCRWALACREWNTQMQGLQDLFKAFGGRTSRKRMTVAQSYDILIGQEADKLLDDEAVRAAALEAVQENGIVFLDEIDKICARSDARGADVCREGVQRDLLPLIEGTTVSTKHGPVKTDHILFIARGAFHIAKPSDLLPELQGRLPIRVELAPLTEDDFVRILTETDNALTRQYTALMATEEVTVTFTPDGIAALARIAAEVNRAVENIGARRLYTVMERVFEELSFNAPDRGGQSVTVDALRRNQSRRARPLGGHLALRACRSGLHPELPQTRKRGRQMRAHPCSLPKYSRRRLRPCQRTARACRNQRATLGQSASPLPSVGRGRGWGAAQTRFLTPGKRPRPTR